MSYFEGISPNGVQLAIVGKDPFPTKPNGIPFCKSSWDEQFADNCSGGHVLLSLGIRQSVRDCFDNPTECFINLRDHGVVFLNASYRFVGAPLTKKRNMIDLTEAYQRNKEVLTNAEVVLYCGEASKVRWVASIDRQGSYCIVHPDVRNRANPLTKCRWQEWWSEGAVCRNIGLTIPSSGPPT